MCADSTCPYYLAVYGQQLAGGCWEKRYSSCYCNLAIPSLLEATQTSLVLSPWTVTAWSASLGWLTVPAGATLEGHLACFIRRLFSCPNSPNQGRCHADRLAGPLFSAGFTAHQTPVTPLPGKGLVCSASPLAQSSPKHTYSPTQSFTHWPLDLLPSSAHSLVPTPYKTVDWNQKTGCERFPGAGR